MESGTAPELELQQASWCQSLLPPTSRAALPGPLSFSKEGCHNGGPVHWAALHRQSPRPALPRSAASSLGDRSAPTLPSSR